MINSKILIVRKIYIITGEYKSSTVVRHGKGEIEALIDILQLSGEPLSIKRQRQPCCRKINNPLNKKKE